MKDLSYVEIGVIATMCVLPVVMGLVLVFLAVCQKTGTSDVESWPSEGEDQEMGPGYVEKPSEEYEYEIDTEDGRDRR